MNENHSDNQKSEKLHLLSTIMKNLIRSNTLKKTILFISLLFLKPTINFGQDLAIPKEILARIKTEKIVNLNEVNDTLTFKIIYPEKYNAKKEYKILFGLSGGNQTSDIVDYCYAAWFKSDYFTNYITILPVNTKHKSLKECKPNEIKSIYATLKNKFKTKEKWIIAGTSNGGVATFNFVAVEPTLFEGVIVIPGVLNDEIEITDAWKHLKFVLAYGEKDAVSWISGAQKSKTLLEGKVKSCTTFEMKDQGHILPLGFDINSVYAIYFKK